MENLKISDIKRLVKILGGESVVEGILYDEIKMATLPIEEFPLDTKKLEKYNSRNLIYHCQFNYLSQKEMFFLDLKDIFLNKPGEDKIYFFMFKKEMTTKEVISEMSSIGYRPSTFDEFLASWWDNKDSEEFIKSIKDKNLPISILGSETSIGEVACLFGIYNGGGLDLRFSDKKWHEGFCFPAVRK